MTQNVEKTFTNGTDCNNGVFGDPAVGSAKNCWVALPGSSSGSTGSGSSPGSGSTPSNGITPANTTWTQCATQNGYCSFTGTMVVLYGTLTQNVEKTFANGTACNNGVFGDPAVGVSDKACWVAVPNTTTGGGSGSGSGSGSGGSMPPTQTMSCTSPTKSGAPSGSATVSADTPGSDSTRMFAMGSNFSRAVLTNVASSDTLNWSIADATGKVATSSSFAGPAGATTTMLTCSSTLVGYFAVSATLAANHGQLPPAGTLRRASRRSGVVPNLSGALAAPTYAHQDQHRFGI